MIIWKKIQLVKVNIVASNQEPSDFDTPLDYKGP